eukprot:CAMPEP_0168578572 /NCGR_PEP_ID=MMETSP0413-20121227/21405_1 /TAXON_ID=136452 /ORGANISM="Filamoeba nolandi, Strain NC-AS-23-1" /LENGTH=492 /DNA_ID=CAMNT_0008612429 /DNA_START=679 /DNA_END=2157 /DNA_ORIENTATION=+
MEESSLFETASVSDETKSTSSEENEVPASSLPRTPSPPSPIETAEASSPAEVSANMSSPIAVPKNNRRGSAAGSAASSPASPSTPLRRKKTLRKCESVKVPAKFERTFLHTEDSLKHIFQRTSRLPFRGELKVAGQRYLAIRTDSLSNDFLKATQFLVKESPDPLGVASFLYQIAHLIGKFDSANFEATCKDDLNAKEVLAAGFVAPAFLGLSRSTVHPDSISEKFRFTYSHLCLNSQSSQQCLQCAWTSAYTTGWLSRVSKSNLQSVEVSCLSHGDKQCCSVIAPAQDMSEQLTTFFQENKHLKKKNCHQLASMNALEEQRNSFEATKPKKPKMKIPTLSFRKDTIAPATQSQEEITAAVNGIQKEISAEFFENMKWDIKTGSIFFANQNYFLMNSCSFFVDMFNHLKSMINNEERGVQFALSTLFEITQYMGTADCMYFSQKAKKFPTPRETLQHKIAAVKSFLAQTGKLSNIKLPQSNLSLLKQGNSPT